MQAGRIDVCSFKFASTPQTAANEFSNNLQWQMMLVKLEDFNPGDLLRVRHDSSPDNQSGTSAKWQYADRPCCCFWHGGILDRKRALSLENLKKNGSANLCNNVISSNGQTFSATAAWQCRAVKFSSRSNTLLQPGSQSLEAQLFDGVLARDALGSDDPHDGKHCKSAVVELSISHFICVHVKSEWVPEVASSFLDVILEDRELKEPANRCEDDHTEGSRIAEDCRKTRGHGLSPGCLAEPAKPQVVLADGTYTCHHSNSSMFDLADAVLIECLLILWRDACGVPETQGLCGAQLIPGLKRWLPSALLSLWQLRLGLRLCGH